MSTPKPSATGQLSYNASGDINKLIQQIYATKDPNYLKTAQGSTNPIYNPLISDIAAQGDAAKVASAANSKELKSIYGSLQSNIGNEGNTIKANTIDATNAQNSNTSQAVGAIGNNYANAQGNTANLLAKLGIQAAAPDALARGTEHQGFLQGISSLQGQNATNLAQQLGANSLNYNSAQKNIAGFEGNQKVAQNQTNLTNTIAALNSTKANIKSQRAGAVASLAQQLRDQFTSSRNSQASSLVSAYQAQQTTAAQIMAAQLAANSATGAAQIGANAQTSAAQIAAGAQVAAAKAASDAVIQQAKLKAKTDASKIAASLAKVKPTKGTVGQQIYNYAGTIFGTDTALASKAVALATSIGTKQYPNAQAYADAVIHKAGKGAQSDKLRALAFTMWNLLQTNPNLQNYLPGS